MLRTCAAVFRRLEIIMKKFCPLSKTDCFDKDCAWWVEADAQEEEHGANGCCAVLSLTCVSEAIDEVR